MKRLLLLCIMLSTFFSYGQNRVEGKYFNHFGDSLFTRDSIYFQRINVDGYTNTFAGRITKKEDTLYLAPGFDFNSINKNTPSFPNKAIRDSTMKAAQKNEMDMMKKYNWRFRDPLVLLIKGNELYVIDSSGTIDKREFWNGKENQGIHFMKLQ